MITTSVHKQEIRILFNRLRVSAHKRDIEFTLTVVDLYEMSFPITCPILDIPLAFNRIKSADNSYSFDRIDSTIGYHVDNIIIISNRANKLKSDATLDEIRRLLNFYNHMAQLSLIVSSADS